MFFKDFTLHFNALNQGLQTVAHNPNLTREAISSDPKSILSLIKKCTTFTKILLI